MASATRKDAEAHYRRKMDKWKSRSARIIGKAQALNRTQDRKLAHELDMIDKTREYCVKRTQEDIWKVTGADCPVPRLPKPSDLPTYMEGVRPQAVTLPTPAELASLLPKKIIRQQPRGSRNNYTHIPRKRLSVMTSADVQIFHYRKLLERQEEIKSQVVTIISSFMTDDKPKDKSGNGKDTGESSGESSSSAPPAAKKPLGAKWAFARNSLKAIAEQKETEPPPPKPKVVDKVHVDENNNNHDETDSTHPARGSIKVDLEVTRVTISRKPMPKSETPKRRLSVDETPYGHPPTNKSNQITTPSESKLKVRRNLPPHSSFVKPTGTDMRVLKKARPSTSIGVSASGLSGYSGTSKGKAIRTNYAEMYQKLLEEHKKRMTSEGNLSDRSRRSSVVSAFSLPERSASGTKHAELVEFDLEDETEEEVVSPSKPSLISRLAAKCSVKKDASQPEPSINASGSRFTPTSNNESSPYNTRNTSGVAASASSTGVELHSQSPSPSPCLGDPSARGIRQPGTPVQKRESTLMKETAASNRRKTRRISLQRTASGVFISNRLFNEIKQMRDVKEELAIAAEDSNAAAKGEKSAIEMYQEMRNCRYLRRGSSDDRDVDSLPSQPLSEQLQMLKLNSAALNEKRVSFLSKLKEDAEELGASG